MAMLELESDAERSAEAHVDAAAALFSALGDRSRLVIVQHLLLGEHKVVELTQHLGLAQSTVSKHLACLLGCGLVTVRSQGRASIYSLAHPDATRRFLESAEQMLVLTGDAVTSCDLTGARGL